MLESKSPVILQGRWNNVETVKLRIEVSEHQLLLMTLRSSFSSSAFNFVDSGGLGDDLHAKAATAPPTAPHQILAPR